MYLVYTILQEVNPSTLELKYISSAKNLADGCFGNPHSIGKDDKKFWNLFKIFHSSKTS